MTNKETVEQNIGLTFDFVRYLIANPEKIELLPDFSILEFVGPDFVKEQKEDTSEAKEPVLYVKVKNTFEIIK